MRSITPQSSVGAAQIGSFSTYGMGLQATVAHGPVGAQLYYTQTGKGFNTQNPFGDHASNLRAEYAAGNGTFLEGLVATFRYPWLHQDDSPQTATQMRAYLNYAVRF